MEVTLKHIGFAYSDSVADPFNRTLEVLWEVDGDFQWTDDMNEYTTIVHRFKPVVMKERITRTYQQVKEPNNGTTTYRP